MSYWLYEYISYKQSDKGVKEGIWTSQGTSRTWMRDLWILLLAFPPTHYDPEWIAWYVCAADIPAVQ